MKKWFVSFEQAMLLKEYGYDEPCLAIYDSYNDHEFHLVSDYGVSTRSNSDTFSEIECTAPLISQALDWFRAEGAIRLSGVVKHYLSGTYSFNISRHNGGNTGWDRVSAFIEKGFYNYHDAESACLDKVIEIYEDILKENPPFGGGNR